MKKPNFFIIGAPKCGTTSLVNWLMEHPNAFMTEPKEPFFFDTDIKARYKYTLENYQNLYERATDHHIALGEASTTYLYSKVAVDNILKYNPFAKFIVLLRHPVEMVLSLHHQEVFSLNEDVTDFEKAWRLQDDRLNGRNIPKTCIDPKKLQYKLICQLGSQVEALLKKTDEKQVLILTLENLKTCPQKTYFMATNFLSLPRYDIEIYDNKNPSKKFKSKFIQSLLLYGVFLRKRIGINRGFGLSKLNMKIKDRAAPDKRILNEIEECFEEEILKIERLTGIKL